MSSLLLALKRLSALFSTRQPQCDLDSMSLREWADLPPHHPLRDRAPC